MPSFSSFFDYWHNIAKKKHMLHILLLCSFYTALCSNWSIFTMSTPSRSTMHSKMLFVQVFMIMFEFCQKRHMLHISLLCSINAAVCCNQGMYSMDTPSRSIQHKKIPQAKIFIHIAKIFLIEAHVLYISLLRSIIAAVCSNHGMILIDTPSRLM